MTDCSVTPGTPGDAPKRSRCPHNGQLYPRVPSTTLLHHLKQPWQRDLAKQAFYFCADRHCPVIYFTGDGAVIGPSGLRTRVGLKSASADALICYCFGVTRRETGDPVIRQFVRQQTRQGTCACQVRNPAGRCCLRDFPKD